MPVDAEQSDQWVSVGLSPVSGAARVTIDQRPNRFTVTIALPDEQLDRRVLLVNGHRFNTTVSYNVPPQILQGGYGAAGAPEVTEPRWVGDHFVIPDALAGWTPNWTKYSLKDGNLAVEMTHRVPATGQVQGVTQLLKRVP